MNHQPKPLIAVPLDLSDEAAAKLTDFLLQIAHQMSARALSAASCSTVARSRLEPRRSTAALSVAMRSPRTSISRSSAARLFKDPPRSRWTVRVGPGHRSAGADAPWTSLRVSPESTQ